MRNAKRPVTTQHQQSIQFESFYTLDEFIGDINGYLFTSADHLTCIGIAAVRRAKNCATARQDAAYIFNTKRYDSFFIYEPVVTITYPKNFTVIFIYSGLHHSTDYCIKPGRVATAREDTYSLHDLSPSKTIITHPAIFLALNRI